MRYLETVTECRFLKKFEKSCSKSEAKLNAKIHLLKDLFVELLYVLFTFKVRKNANMTEKNFSNIH